MGYKDYLMEACSKVEGAYACTIMGYDGIVVDSHETGAVDTDINSILVEYSNMMGKIAKSGSYLSTGEIRDLTIGGENMAVTVRPISDEYFIALVTSGQANVGKAKFYLRVLTPKIRQELLG